MSATFVLKKEPPFFVMDGATDMNVGVFWETCLGFLESVALQFFSKYSQSYVNMNVKNKPKINYS